MSYKVYIHNISGSQKIYRGVPIADSSFYEIEPQNLYWYQASDDVINDISDDDIRISADGVSDYSTSSAKNISYLLGDGSMQLKHVTSSKGIPLFAVSKRDGGEFLSIISHDWSNKTTWYPNSVRVTAETLTQSGLEYSGVNDYWIDLVSGNVPDEDDFSGPYLVKVYDNAIEITTGFSIDHVLGKVVFDSAPSGPVTADYSYATNSTWSLVPSSGKVINIEYAELDFSVDSTVHNVSFEIWGYNPQDLPNKIMYSKRVYKNIKDVIKIANQIEIMEPIGDLSKKFVRAVFDYAKVVELKSSQGLELRIKIEDDVPFSGDFSSLTVYTTTEDEV